MKPKLKNTMLLCCCLFIASIEYIQAQKTSQDIIQHLNAKGKAIGKDYFYTNIPGTHIYLRMVSSRTYGYSGLLNHWSNGAECLVNEYYNVDVEKTISHFQSIGGNAVRRDTIVNGRKATVLIGERRNGIISHTLIMSDHKQVAAILLQYPKNIPKSEMDIFQTMLYSTELYSEASIDTFAAMAIAPFIIDWQIANDLSKLKKQIELMESSFDKSLPSPLVFYGMNEGSYEFTNNGVAPDNINTSRVRIQHTLKSEFEGDAKAYLRQCLNNYGLDSKIALNTPIDEQLINGDKVWAIAFSFQFKEDEMESNYMLYLYEDSEKFMNLIIGIKPSSNPFQLLYATEQARNFAKSLKIRTL